MWPFHQYIHHRVTENFCFCFASCLCDSVVDAVFGVSIQRHSQSESLPVRARGDIGVAFEELAEEGGVLLAYRAVDFLHGAFEEGGGRLVCVGRLAILLPEIGSI